MTQQTRRILIVEDEFILAMLLEDLLSDMGHQVVASIASLDKAMEFAGRGDVDFAILDINLGGEKSFPVAAILRRRGIPFVFATGYGSAGLTTEYDNEFTLQKPYEPKQLRRAISEAPVTLRDGP
ncbi:response regulator [Mesorhizobium sp. CC13]|uniref:response regulator n=1 Tax=Mesorhizobium sp. CC13 TaxID=3029194 RepID=UPI003263DE62